MKNIIKYFIISVLLTNIISASETGVVNTDILLVKKYPKNDSKKLSFYKMNDLITIIGEQKDSDDLLWYKTNKGFIKSQYVIKESELPIFLNSNEVDSSKNAIQLIVFNLNAKKALIRLKKILKNEKNIFVQRTNKAQVVYLVNFKNYKEAKAKQEKISKYYKTSFITKIKNLDNKNNKVVKTVINKDTIKQKNIKLSNISKKEDSELKYIDRNIEDEVGTIDVDKQMAEFDDDVNEKRTEYINNEKEIYTVNKVRTLNFSNHRKEKTIKKELENIEEIKVTKISKKDKKEESIKTVVKKIKPIKAKIEKKETQVEENFYVNNVEAKQYKTKSRFNLRVFDHSKKNKKVKEKNFKNNYFKNEVKMIKPVIVEKTKPKMPEAVKEKIVIKKVIPIKKIKVIKPNLTDKIENLLMSL